MLATAIQNPLFWAVLIGWILSVTLHELAHGIVAHLGGDYTIRERGGLTLNPLQYVDPLTSLVFPIIIFLIGGVPLPGGVTYVRDDLLRSRLWSSAVSTAGPLMNLLLFLGCAIAVHPSVGWVDDRLPVTSWSSAQQFVTAMTYVQMLAVILNLVPVPGLDGFGIIAPWLSHNLRETALAPHLRPLYFFGFFMLLMTPVVGEAIFVTIARATQMVGLDPRTVFDCWVMVIRG